MAKRKTSKVIVALMVSVVMAVSFVSPALGSTQLATPEVIADQPIVNYRWIIYTPVEGATYYNVYAFATFDDAVEGTNYVAVARNVVDTIGSISEGGTTVATSPEVPEGMNRIDVRLLQFEGEATRTLPSNYTPAGLGDSFFPGDGRGDTTNLRPGQYWFRIRAVSDDDSVQSSEMSAVQDLPFTIAMGPDELRAYLEANLERIGTPSLRLIDLRNPAEFADEGNLRFFEDRYVHAEFNTLETAQAIFGHVNNKDAVTIIVLCRGGGRTVTASQNLARFGYTNVINAQGVNQLTFGLMYDDPAFALRGPGHTADEPVAPFVAGNAIHWLNVPRAAFEIFAFNDATETDPANAAHSAIVPALDQDLSGSNAERLWERSFDLDELGILDRTAYYFRMRAIPEANLPVRGYVPATYWGAPSALTEPLGAADFDGIFADVSPDAWYYDAVMYVFAHNNDIMQGFEDGTFRPDTALNRAQLVTILYRLAGSPDVSDLEDPFTDASGHWAYNYIIWAYANGVTTGFDDGTFRPNQNVSMQELAAFIARDQAATDRVPPTVLMDYTWQDAGEIEVWARGYVNTLTAQGLYRDIDSETFNPTAAASRAIVASLLYRWLTALYY